MESGGSPGRAETYIAEPQRAIVINEFLANTDDPLLDFVELFNTRTLNGEWGVESVEDGVLNGEWGMESAEC